VPRNTFVSTAGVPRNTFHSTAPRGTGVREEDLMLNEGYDKDKTIAWIRAEQDAGRQVEFIIQDGSLRPLIKNASGHDEPMPFNKALPRNSFNYSILPMSKEIERQTGVSASAIYREFIENTQEGAKPLNIRNHQGFWRTAMRLMGRNPDDTMTVVNHRPKPDAYLGGCYGNAHREHLRTGNHIILGAQFNSFGNSLASLSPHAVNKDAETGELYDTATNDYIARTGQTRVFIPTMNSADSKLWVEDLMAKRPHEDLGETIGFYELITQGDNLFVLRGYEPKRGQDLRQHRWGAVETIDLRPFQAEAERIMREEGLEMD